MFNSDYFSTMALPYPRQLLVVLLLLSLNASIAEEIMEGIKSHANLGLLNVPADECGTSSNDRIIGGRQAKLGQYPWMARLGYIITPNDKHFAQPHFSCGGSIINSRNVLSVAHCCPPHLVLDPSTSVVTLKAVRLGELVNSTNPDCVDGVCAPPVQDIDVEEHFPHPGFVSATFENDICLVRLKEDIQFSRWVLPICMPVYNWFQNNPAPDHDVQVAGWGYTSKGQTYFNDDLMTITIKIVPNSNCKQVFSDKRYVITENHLCAASEPGHDSCKGDSGGPLMTSKSIDGPPRYFIVGIVSFGGPECGEVPGVNTKVSKYLPWILDNINNHTIDIRHIKK